MERNVIYYEKEKYIRRMFIAVGMIILAGGIGAAMFCMRYAEKSAHAENSGTVDGNVVFAPDFQYKYGIDSYKKRASDIFLGEIEDVEYAVNEGIPWSIYTVSVKTAFKGDHSENDRVEIYELGGYLSYSEFKQEYWELDEDYSCKIRMHHLLKNLKVFTFYRRFLVKRKSLIRYNDKRIEQACL